MFQFVLELLTAFIDVAPFGDSKEKRAKRMVAKLSKESWFASYYDQPAYKTALYHDKTMRDKLSSYKFVNNLYQKENCRRDFLAYWDEIASQ
ncbi:hypothetical protein [Paenilisteria weihenstephanensis]|uniref:hypothetical protein n=1 Tax=Listeria weihenstephanensis TaxID=1006155 RepID=UPI0004BB2530|nr:hypothetical protein [Listeria weihenstephanensis]